MGRKAFRLTLDFSSSVSKIEFCGLGEGGGKILSSGNLGSSFTMPGTGSDICSVMPELLQQQCSIARWSLCLAPSSVPTSLQNETEARSCLRTHLREKDFPLSLALNKPEGTQHFPGGKYDTGVSAGAQPLLCCHRHHQLRHPAATTLQAGRSRTEPMLCCPWAALQPPIAPHSPFPVLPSLHHRPVAPWAAAAAAGPSAQSTAL